MKLSLNLKFGIAGVVAFLAFILSMIAGWVTNLFWLVGNMGTINGEFILALVGVFLGPLGALHGIYTWF